MWGCLGVCCASTAFFQQVFLALPPFSSVWDLFAQTLSGPHFLYLAGPCTTYSGHYMPYLHPATHLIGKTRNQADSGVQYLLTRVIYSLFCSLPWHLSFSHSLQQGLMPCKFISTNDLKLAHKWILLLPTLGSPALLGNWGNPLQRVVCWEPPARALPVISGIYL